MNTENLTQSREHLKNAMAEPIEFNIFYGAHQIFHWNIMNRSK